MKLATRPSSPTTNTKQGRGDLHPAVGACIEAKERSRAFELILKREDKKRHGNLFLDMFRFKRQTHATGRDFNGLILLHEDTVAHKLAAGQPAISREEKAVRPLPGFTPSCARLKTILRTAGIGIAGPGNWNTFLTNQRRTWRRSRKRSPLGYNPVAATSAQEQVRLWRRT